MSVKYGLIHCHSDNSMKDSTLKAKDLVKRAKAMGSPAITLTDHGTMSGIYEFLRAAEAVVKDGKVIEPAIKAIPGVEAYFEEDNSDIKRSHLVLLAKNYDGYIAICKALSKANTRIDGVPRMNFDILNEFFGPNSSGYNNVIATSACLGGVLATILLRNSVIDEEILKIRNKQNKYSSPENTNDAKLFKDLSELQKNIEALTSKRDTLKTIAEKKYAMRERALWKLSDDERKPLAIALEAEKSASEKAKYDLISVKAELSSAKKEATALKKQCQKISKSQEMYLFYEKEIESLKTGKKSDVELYVEAVETAKKFREIFGNENFYIELQYHGIQAEANVMPLLAKLAEAEGYPVVAANDVHYAEKTNECIRARRIISSLRFNKWNEPTPDDTEYYIKSDEELTEWLCKILPTSVVLKAMEGVKSIVDSCNVLFPKGTHFPRFINDGSETSSERLRRLVNEGIFEKFPNGDFIYQDRVDYELSIIEKMNYTDYLCIVQDFLSYARKEEKNNHEGVGYYVGPGRGSAAGSLVCYLIGITSVNPMEFDLLFERFLNPDRISSPDIDCDLAKAIRGSVVEYIKSKYGEKAVCSICTKGTAAGRKAIESVARIRGSELYGNTDYFFELGKQIKKHIPLGNDGTLVKCKETLYDAFSDDEDAMAIINDALLIEGTYLTYGMHAAGIIVADNEDVRNYIPVMWNEAKGQWCSQCDMVEAEMQAGLLKIDLLGLKNLDIISDTLRTIKQNKGITIDIEKVPYDSDVFKNIFSKGHTDFVFQFASPGMKNMLKRFKPTNIHHLVLLVAAYRPGPMQFIDSIIKVKDGLSNPTYICKAVEEILSPTYGVPIYQEQIIALCNKVAGFSLGEADTIRRYMSKKKESEMAKYKPKFIEGLINQGATLEDSEEFWEQLMKFAQYGFNKSHAAAYAVLAYYTAWLKYHYPAEYMTAVMKYAEDSDKLSAMVQECRLLGVDLLPPNINKSQETYKCVDNKIIFGLGNIKNVGKSAEIILEERYKAPFVSFYDFVKRASIDKDVFESIADAGAFDIWCKNRVALKTVYPILKDYYTKIEKAKEKLKDTSDESKISNLKGKIQGYTDKINRTLIPATMPEDKELKLLSERELLGMYVSGHPIDEYDLSHISNVTNIINADSDKQFLNVCGFIRDLRVKKRKFDSKEMAFFELEDATDKISVSCFTFAYDKYKSFISEGNVISVFGKIEIECKDDDTFERKLIVDTIRIIEKKQKTIMVTVPDTIVWVEQVYPIFKKYKSNTGLPAILYDKSMSEFRHINFLVSPDVLTIDIALNNVVISEQEY